jgi:hypothetical protein
MTFNRFRFFALAALAIVAVSLLTARFLKFENVQAQSSRVFELRVYHCFPGRLPALQARFRDHTIRIFNKHHMTSVAYWTPQDPATKDNTLIYILAHESRESATKSWADFRTDPEWQQVAKASEADGKIVEKVDSTFMDPTDYSPMK